MAYLKQVTVSGSVGKQVIPAGDVDQARLEGLILTPSGANATLKIRDGNASGDVVLFARALSAQGSKELKAKHKFRKGMHVTVIGADAEAYLILS